jgi:hypothetical protein
VNGEGYKDLVVPRLVQSGEFVQINANNLLDQNVELNGNDCLGQVEKVCKVPLAPPEFLLETKVKKMLFASNMEIPVHLTDLYERSVD